MSDSVSENWGMDSVGDWSMDSVGNNSGGMDSVVGDGGSGSIVWLSLVGHISDETIIVIGVVLDMLDSAGRKVDRVLTINNTISIIVLSLVEGSAGVVISDSVGVGVGGDLGQVVSNVSSLHWSVVSGSSVDNWGMVGGGSVDSVVDWSVDSVGNNWGSVDGVVGEGGGVVEERSSVDSVVDW